MKTVKLAEVARFVGGGTPDRTNPDFWDGEIPWATVKDFKTLELTSTQERISESGLKNCASNIISAGSVIVPTRMALGKALITKVDVAINQDLRGLILSPEADARYVMRWYISKADAIERLGTGATVKGIKLDDLKSLEVPLPALAEQKRIAAILDAADALRAQRRRALVRLDDLARSLFLHHFGDPVSNPKGWPTGTLGELLSMIRNGVNAEQKTEQEGWPISRIETIADGTINPARVRWITPDDSIIDAFRLKEGDILFSHINSVEHIAKTAIYIGTPPLLIHGINLLRLRANPELADSTWLLHLLKHEALRTYFSSRCKKAVNQASLNQPDIKSAPVYIPPIALQQRFARELAALEAQKSRQRTHLARLDALFASLQSRAFTGGL